MSELPSGLYEQVVNLAVETGLVLMKREGLREPEYEKLDPEESRTILGRYLAEVMERGLQALKEKHHRRGAISKAVHVAESGSSDTLSRQIVVCNALITRLSELSDCRELLDWRIGRDAHRLLAILDKKSARYLSGMPRPETSLSISTLFTGSSLEPSMVNELKKEIRTADRIDMLVSFIKWSGLRLILEDLREFTRYGTLRIITTSYLGATDLKAVLELAALPNTDVRISYDTRTTRLHAKSYMFWRESGFSTAYIGSSNLSSAAIGSGLEWNVKVTEKDMSHIMRNISATFETYWNDPDFQSFLPSDAPELGRALKAERGQDQQERGNFFLSVEPYPFQKEILERLEAEREVHGRYRNLVVAATGTGKTVISAFDYKRFCRKRKNSSRLLFVAHRQEILLQSLKCFRTILRDANFGECWYGDLVPSQWDHLFVSIQTFNAKAFQEKTPPDFYDYIVIDEFHHAAAESYRELLGWYKPGVLLGLTATPERLDGKSVVDLFFDGVMAAEMRLPEAINRQLLVPFQYFGVSDGTDLRTVGYQRGRYEERELENVYTGNDLRTDLILRALKRYVADLDAVIGLGFCVGVEHAKYMAKRFSEHGVPAAALHGATPQRERDAAQRRLVTGEIRFLFTVDLYNEGVDIPEVNTVLFLRPTESLTVFLQQLGRGLRISEGKDVLTVLDFIGQSRQEYSFEGKFRALLGHTHRSLKDEMESGFPALPRGCWIELEKVAGEIVLKNIQDAVFNKRRLLRELRQYEANTGYKPTLTRFLHTFDQLSLSELYQKGSFHSLCVAAGLIEGTLPLPDGSPKNMDHALRKLTHMDSRRWIHFLLGWLREEDSQEEIYYEVKEDAQRAFPIIFRETYLLMFYYAMWGMLPYKVGLESVAAGLALIRSCDWLRQELAELLAMRLADISFVDRPVMLDAPCPLDLHCTYTRDELLAALGHWTVEKRPEMREGVLFIPQIQSDVFLINLRKSEKDFSPTTMYEDYAISDRLFHWQSQSTTAANSATGLRYMHHKKRGTHVLLFVRNAKEEDHLAMPYTFLGKARYVSHTGSRPMSIVWELEEPMPPWLLPAAMQATGG